MAGRNHNLRNIESGYWHYNRTYDTKVSLTEYRNIHNSFNKFMVERLLEGDIITLPERMGLLSVKGKQTSPKYNKDGHIRGLSIDWKKTLALWERNEDAKNAKKLIYHLNMHTQGVRYKFHWSKLGCNVSNKNAYSLNMARAVKKEFKNRIMSGFKYPLR